MVLNITYLSYKWPLLDVVYVVEVAFKKGSERIRVKWLGARVRPRSTPKLVSRGPVLRLALLATVDAGTAFANGERRIFVLDLPSTDHALSPSHSSLIIAILSMLFPMRLLARDTAVTNAVLATSTAHLEPGRFQAELSTTPVAPPPFKPFPDRGIFIEARAVVGSNDF